jgi:uncharacterized protein (TIGR02996 family)
MDGTEESFRATIRANPLDATTRLVYADWLDEHGNPVDAARQRACADPASDEKRLALAAAYETECDAERAEFVRTQVAQGELARGDVRRYCDDRVTQQLIENSLPKWDDDLPKWARNVCDEARHQSYRRGLPVVIHCDIADWLERGEQVLERHAVEEVVFSWYTLRPRLDDWLRSPLTACVKRFVLSGQYLTDDDLRKIAASPALSHVEKLDLSHNSFGDDGVAALANSPNLSHLQELDLLVTRLGSEGFRALTHSDRLPELCSLTVGHNHCAVGDEDMRDLGNSPHRYERLSLYGTAVTDRGVELLCRAKCVAGLKHLDLGGNALTAPAAEALAGSENLGRLESLSLVNTRIGDQGAAAIGRSKTLGRLSNLDLLRAQIGDPGGRELGRASNLKNLAHLDLRHNSCGNTFLSALGESRAFPRLLDLRLNSTSVTPAAVSAVARASVLDSALRLDLGNNEIDDSDIGNLVGAGAIRNLRILILNANQITSVGARALAEAMPPRMAILILSDNRIEDAGALAFLNRVPAHCNLVLHGNPISDGAWQTMEAALGDRFAVEYPDDLLSIPQRGPNRSPVAARTDREPVSNTLVVPTPEVQAAASATETN